MNNDIEKAKERCNQLIKVEHANWIGISNQIAITTVLNYIKELEKERDYYKKMYLETNEGIVAGMKVIEERDKGENLC